MFLENGNSRPLWGSPVHIQMILALALKLALAAVPTDLDAGLTMSQMAYTPFPPFDRPPPAPPVVLNFVSNTLGKSLAAPPRCSHVDHSPPGCV